MQYLLVFPDTLRIGANEQQWYQTEGGRFIIDKETYDDHVKNAEMLDLPQTQLVDLSKRSIGGDISGSAAGGKLDAFRDATRDEFEKYQSAMNKYVDQGSGSGRSSPSRAHQTLSRL